MIYTMRGRERGKVNFTWESDKIELIWKFNSDSLMELTKKEDLVPI